MAYVDVEIDLAVVDDDDLIDELEKRDYVVYPNLAFRVDLNKDSDDRELQNIFWRYKTGYLEDALILLERRFPELTGLSRLYKA